MSGIETHFATKYCPIVDTSSSPAAKMNPVSINDVLLTDSFWQSRQEINRVQTIPAQYQHLVSSGCIDNFKRVTGKSDAPFQGMVFQDSDVYKWLEAAASSLASHPDSKLESLCDDLIALIASAQDTDGYLNTYFSLERKSERWTNLRELHEMYCAGHYIQAAVAYTRATGKTNALEIATKLADCICREFGDGPEQKRLVDGHEEIEMALVELARLTGNKQYLRQAQYFIDLRGHKTIGASEYNQDHAPIRQMQSITGHAVRAVYHTCGATDLALETCEAELITALERLWNNMTQRKMYVSGGIGSRWEGEAFGADYELPNSRAYTETCAAIGSIMWCWRMILLTGDVKYADLIEWTLFNAVMPGLSLDGAEYFYQNPLADQGTHRRQAWFGCACCPPNVARLLSQYSGYWYSTSKPKDDPAIWIHMLGASTAKLQFDDQKVTITQSGDYPWDGNITIDISSEHEAKFTLNIRIPAWAKDAKLHVNGMDMPVKPGTYQSVTRIWREKEQITLELPMPARRIYSSPFVVENAGCVALARGPILYCFESADNPKIDLRMTSLVANAAIATQNGTDLLSGIVTLRTAASHANLSPSWNDELYLTDKTAASSQQIDLTAIPYYAWANREAGQMTVWLRQG